MGRVDQDGAFRRVLGILDEGRALGTQTLDDMAVVDDLVADEDGPIVAGQGQLDDLDRAVDTGTESARAGEQDAHFAADTSAPTASAGRALENELAPS